MTKQENIQLAAERQDLPTPREVLDAVGQAAREMDLATGLLIPMVAIRERACAILYGGRV